MARIVVGLSLVMLVALMAGPQWSRAAPPRTQTPQGSARILPQGGVLTPASFGNWAMLGQDFSRDGAQPLERTLSPANASLLRPIWSAPFRTAGPIAGSVAVANGTAYFGSWDGNVSAVNVSTGTYPLPWLRGFQSASKPQANCTNPANSGVTSTPALWNNLVIVGTGDPRHLSPAPIGYGWVVAVNASGNHSARALWETNLTQNDTGSWAGAYIWSSPVVYRGNVYVGYASGCDAPLVQGELDELNGTTGKIVHQFDVVSGGLTGGDVWSSPSVDVENNTVWITTGNPGPSGSEPFVQSIIALNATTLGPTPIGYWQQSAVQGDYDFGAGATLFSAPNGVPLVASLNKDGVVYVFDRSTFRGHVQSSPLWSYTVDPAQRNDVSPAAFGGGLLYVAGKVVRAFYPYNGTVKWAHTSYGYVYAGLTYANGLLIDGATWTNGSGGTLEVLNASSGAELYHLNVSYLITGQPAVADGRIYFGTAGDTVGSKSFQGPGYLYELGLPLAYPTPSWEFAPNPDGNNGGAGNATFSAQGGGAPPYSCGWSFGFNSYSSSCLTVSFPYPAPFPVRTTSYTITDQIGDAQADAASFKYSLTQTPYSYSCKGQSYLCIQSVWGVSMCYGPGLHCFAIAPVVPFFAFNAYLANVVGNPSYNWNFGDGSPPSPLAEPAHVYQSAGTYTVTLTVSDSENHPASVQFQVSVT